MNIYRKMYIQKNMIRKSVVVVLHMLKKKEMDKKCHSWALLFVFFPPLEQKKKKIRVRI